VGLAIVQSPSLGDHGAYQKDEAVLGYMRNLYHPERFHFHHRLEIDARKEEGGVLHAPYGRQMIERVAETMSSEVELRFSSLATGEGLYEGRGRHACLEVQGDLPAILDD